MQFQGKFNRGARISAEEVLQLAIQNRLKLLDVRSPKEFSRGHFPGSQSGPILEDAERHLVGLTYKQKGQAAAIALGQELVSPVKAARITHWQHLLRGGDPVISCWRGGLRSETAQAWLEEAGTNPARLQGGYKALRAILLKSLKAPLSGFVLTGMTGGGKTRLLEALQLPQTVNLERLANHRGSAFGAMGAQPAQQTFENALGFELFRTRNQVLLEDESRLVGRCSLPEPFFHHMLKLPRIRLIESVDHRVEMILREYIELPLKKDDAQKLKERLTASVSTLKNRLGGLETAALLADLSAAFQTGDNDLHRKWIRQLLQGYYDKLYEYSLQKAQVTVVFAGNSAECKEWLKENFLPQR